MLREPSPASPGPPEAAPVGRVRGTLPTCITHPLCSFSELPDGFRLRLPCKVSG